MRTAVLTQASSASRVENPAIHPFTYRATQSELDELRRRVLATRLPEEENEPGQSSGVLLATVEKLKDYWAKTCDWREVPAKRSSISSKARSSMRSAAR